MTKISHHLPLEVILCQLWIYCFSALNSPFITCAGKTVSFVSWCNTKLCQQRGLERHCSRKEFFWLSLALHVTSPTPGLHGSCGFQGTQLLQGTWPAAPSSQQLLVKYPLERFCKGIPAVRQYIVMYFAWQPKRQQLPCPPVSHRGVLSNKMDLNPEGGLAGVGTLPWALYTTARDSDFLISAIPMFLRVLFIHQQPVPHYSSPSL